jgi:hypothetical protein
MSEKTQNKGGVKQLYFKQKGIKKAQKNGARHPLLS